MRRPATLLAGLCVGMAVTIAAGAGNAFGRTVTDMVGRTVPVPENAHRLVTTFKPASLCVAALKLQDRLVAVDTETRRDRLQTAAYPPITRLPVVGQKSTGLNFEAILATAPDLVILFAQKDGIAIADRLVAHGVAAIVILPETLPALFDALALIADMAGVPDRAAHAVAVCRRVVDLAGQRVASIAAGDRRRVYFASPLGLFTTASGDMLQDEIIRLAGAANAGHELSGYFREISPEQFIAWDPDIVVMSGNRNRHNRQILGQPQFAEVRAVAGGRVYDFPSNIAPWDFPSPLSALGVLWLAATCYPDRFADVDLAAEIEQFHVTLFGKGFAALGGRWPE